MLDSTGYTRTEKVQCFMCERVYWEFKAYTPQFGHSGQKLDVGSCIESDAQHPMKNWKGSKLFSISKFSGTPGRSSPGRLDVNEYELKPSGASYHYSGYIMPEFGHYVGQVVWTCEQCVQYFQREAMRSNSAKTLNESVHDAVWESIQQAYGNVSGLLLSLGVLKISGRTKGLQAVPKELRPWAVKTIGNLHTSISQSNTKALHKGALRAVKRLHALCRKS